MGLSRRSPRIRLRSLSEYSLLLRHMMLVHLLRSRPETILYVLRRIRLWFSPARGLAAGPPPLPRDEGLLGQAPDHFRLIANDLGDRD